MICVDFAGLLLLLLLMFSSEIHVFPGDFMYNRLPAALSLLSENQMLFHVGGWCPYCILTWCLAAIREYNSAGHNMHWTCSCGVYIIIGLSKGHQLVHACKPGMKRVFLFEDVYVYDSSRDINFLFWIHFIQTSVYVYNTGGSIWCTWNFMLSTLYNNCN
jgi:hypothetical protein